MVWYLVALAVALIAGAIGLLFKQNYYYSSFETLGPSFFTKASILGFVVACGLNFYFNDQYRVKEVISTQRIETLGDGGGVRGSFFLGTGSIQNMPVYMYYTQNSAGEYRLRHVDADLAHVVYTDDTPTVVRYRHTSANHWKAAFVGWSEPTTGFVEFRVPKGSIKQQIVLDAQ